MHPSIFDGCESNFFVSQLDAPESIHPGRYNVMRLMDAWKRDENDLSNASVVSPAIGAIPRARIEEIIRSHVMDIIDAALDATGNKVFVDKSPIYMLMPVGMDFINEIMSNAIKMHLVRDFRAVYNSYRNAHPDYWVASYGAHSFCNTVIRSYEHLPNNITTVRYEDLCNKPRKFFSRILDVLPVEYGDREIFPIIGADDPDREKAPDWQEALPKDDIDIIEQRLGPLLEKYGY